MYLSMYMTLSSYLVETCNCSYLWNYVPYMGCASHGTSVWMNLILWGSNILSSERVSNKCATFVLTNLSLQKYNYNKSC